MRILYVDPSLYHTLGHHFNVANALVEEMGRQGHKVELLISKTARPDINGLKLFGKSVYAQMGLEPDVASDSAMLRSSEYRYCSEIIETIAHFNPDLIYAHSVGAPFCEGALHALRMLYHRDAMPKLVAELPYPSESDTNYFYSAQLKKMFRRLRKQNSMPMEKLVPVTVSSETSRRLSNAIEHVVYTLPSPYSTDVIRNNSKKINSKSIKIGSIGHQYKNKGFELLPEIIKFSSTKSKNIEFFVQIQLDSNEETVRSLRDMIAKGFPIRLVEKDLDDTEYKALMLELDIVLLPYQPSRYQSSISGVCYEALAQGSVIVAPRGTTIGAIVENYQPGANLFENWNSKSIAESLVNSIRNFNSLIEEATEGAKAYRSENGPEAYVRSLCQYASKGNNRRRFLSISPKFLGWFSSMHKRFYRRRYFWLKNKKQLMGDA